MVIHRHTCVTAKHRQSDVYTIRRCHISTSISNTSLQPANKNYIISITVLLVYLLSLDIPPVSKPCFQFLEFHQSASVRLRVTPQFKWAFLLKC